MTRLFKGHHASMSLHSRQSNSLQREDSRIVNQLPFLLPSIVTNQPAGNFMDVGKILRDLIHSLLERNSPNPNQPVRRSAALLRDPRPGLLPARGMGSNQITVPAHSY